MPPTATTAPWSAPPSPTPSAAGCSLTSRRFTSTAATPGSRCCAPATATASTTSCAAPNDPAATPERAQGRTAGAALDHRAHQLVAVELRATAPQHRPQPLSPPRATRPGNRLDHHRQTLQMGRPMEPHVAAYSRTLLVQTLPAPPTRFQRLTRRPSREHPPASEPLNQHEARRYKQKCRFRGESQYRRDGPQSEDDRVDDKGDLTCREVPAHESPSRYSRRHLMSPFSRGPQVRTSHFYQPDAGLSGSNAGRRAGPRPGHAPRPAAVRALGVTTGDVSVPVAHREVHLKAAILTRGA